LRAIVDLSLRPAASAARSEARGFGFVEFADADEAEAAQKNLDHTPLDGREVSRTATQRNATRRNATQRSALCATQRTASLCCAAGDAALLCLDLHSMAAVHTRRAPLARCAPR
jgi:hypothetical protein